MSPNWEIKKTLILALIVATLKTQCCINKKETALIHSQKKIILIKSNEQKNKKANCENKKESITIVDPKKSYSKYWKRKTRHTDKATNKIEKK